MARLTGKDYREILNLVYLANRCEDLKGFIDVLFPPMMHTFNAECATFHLVRGCPQHIDIVESRSFKSGSRTFHEDKYYPVLYKNSFYQCSPLLKEATSSSKVALKIGESFSFKDWERSVLYNDFIRPQHLYWELFLSLRWKNDLDGMITLWRTKKQPDYGDKEVLKAAMLASHLGVVVHNICLISRINTRKSNFLPADEASDEGLLCLDHRFQPAFFNAKAGEICLQLSGIKQRNITDMGKRDFPIPASVIKDCADLLDLVKAEGQPTVLPKERVVSTEGGRRVRVECALIWNDGQAGPTPNFMVTFADLTDAKKLETALQSRFQLSRREIDVTNYLVRGLSDSEIGEKLYISRQTVHTHIKSIYRKLCVKSRIELYRIVTQENCSGTFNQQPG